MIGQNDKSAPEVELIDEQRTSTLEDRGQPLTVVSKPPSGAVRYR